MKMEETELFHAYMGAEIDEGIMLDVGAHYGGSSRPFLESGWRVFAFEPNDENRAHLMDEAERFEALSIDERAVSDKTESGLPIYRSNVSSGISGLHAFHESHQQAGVVDTVSLTDFCEAQRLRRVDFLKIDTEGYDLFVLKGFPWSVIQPDFIECEFEDRKTLDLGYSHAELANFLVERGYTVLVSEWEPIVEYGGNHQWFGFKAWPCALESADAWGNFMAFREAPDWVRLMTSVANVSAPVAIPTKVPAVMDVESYLKRRWSDLLHKEGVKGVYWYGAGKHSRWLFQVIHHVEGPVILGVLDDVPAEDSAFDPLTVSHPSSVVFSAESVVLLSSDVIQEKMRENWRMKYGNEPRLIDLYEDYPCKGPYVKTEL